MKKLISISRVGRMSWFLCLLTCSLCSTHCNSVDEGDVAGTDPLEKNVSTDSSIITKTWEPADTAK